ncbi:MAG: SDR family NAD(P)-dependent oxidoreductase [Paracoccaceae bacterium]
MSLEGRTAIVTGAGTGLGLEIARLLSARGANIVSADILDAERGAEAARANGRRAIATETDVSDKAAVDAMVAAALAEFGTVDILVNNAAISRGMKLKPFEEVTVAEFRRMIDVNTLSVLLTCQAVSAHMRARRYGRIVNMVSGTAFKGAPNLAAYVASKGAVISLTRALAQEFGPDNVVVNAVSPGYTLTESNLENTAFDSVYRPIARDTRALKRDALPEDVARVAAFLASDDAGFVSGQIIAADGGSVYH